MYSTCLFCSTDLGRNTSVEVFPVGRRLAFDAARGRLWVICRSCERWNLSPLEERWEAVERCEALYATSRRRVATANIGLARLRDGLDLIRIGEPQRPEMAAWRYGDQFGRRRVVNGLKAAVGLTAFGAALVGSASAGAGVLLFGGFAHRIGNRIIRGDPDEVVARVYTGEGRLVGVTRGELPRVTLRRGDDGDWQLVLPYGRRRGVIITGDAAYRASSSVLPALNRYGGSRRQVQQAVAVLEQHGTAEAFLRSAARSSVLRDPPPIADMPYRTRLAIEMAVHEDVERRALQGELEILERAWREAEQIAGIADDLLIPASVTERLGTRVSTD